MTGKAAALAAVAVSALVAACTHDDAAERKRTEPGPGDRPTVSEDEWGLAPATWVLERISRDGTTIWIVGKENMCDQFDHADVVEIEDGLRVDVFNRVPRRPRPCTSELAVVRHRVDLPRPLGGDMIYGGCAPDATPCRVTRHVPWGVPGCRRADGYVVGCIGKSARPEPSG